jgi:hypothetical protein
MKIRHPLYAASVLVMAVMMFVFVIPAYAQNAIQDCESASITKDKLGHIWSKPGLDLRQFNAIVIERPGTSTLPVPAKFNYDEYAGVFHTNLVNKIQSSSFFSSVSSKKAQGVGPNTLVLKSELVELNPGSAAARWAVGFGAGRAAVGIRASVLAGGKEVVMCWYGRRLGTSSLDSMAMLNQGMFRLSEDLNAYFSRVYNTGQ